MNIFTVISYGNFFSLNTQMLPKMGLTHLHQQYWVQNVAFHSINMDRFNYKGGIIWAGTFLPTYLDYRPHSTSSECLLRLLTNQVTNWTLSTQSTAARTTLWLIHCKSQITSSLLTSNWLLTQYALLRRSPLGVNYTHSLPLPILYSFILTSSTHSVFSTGH